jgi:hypothetical protein
MNRERVAILGYSEDTLWEAPFDDKTWTLEKGSEIWGLNELWRVKRYKDKGIYPDPAYDSWNKLSIRYDRWFEMHNRGKSTEEEIDWLKKCGVSIYMTKHHADIPQSIAYPLAEMVKRFETNYFTNTISYELALAISEGFKEIHLYGVNMAQWSNEGPTEIRDQRASIEYFLGWARAKGIKVVIPAASDLLKTAIHYGFDEHADTVKEKVLKLRESYRKSAKEYRAIAEYYEGVAKGVEIMDRTWYPPGDDA